MRGNNFQELEVLALPEINQLCDELAELVDRLSGEEIVLCGSLAKLFAKNIPEDYLIKDVDFVVSRDVFKILQRQSCELHAVVSVEKTPERIILHTLFLTSPLFSNVSCTHPFYAHAFFCDELYRDFNL